MKETRLRLKSWYEWDALTDWRKVESFQSGERKKIKRGYRKRVRRLFRKLVKEIDESS